MKKLSIILKLALIVITFLSCSKKDDDSNKNSDPCAGIVCLNGGTCVNGECDCPDGYSGPACGDQVTPTKIKITKVVVTRFPATDTGGAGWDLTSGPDIYILIIKGSTLIWENQSFFIEDANPSLEYSFTPSTNVYLYNPFDIFSVYLYDYDDFDADDVMGGFYFTPYSSTNNFPNMITVDGGGSVAFDLYFAYFWE